MTAGSRKLVGIHSLQRYADPDNSRLNGTVIGFKGDRSSLGNPIPVEPQTQKAWTWKAGKYAGDQVQCAAFYAQQENRNKLWALLTDADTDYLAAPHGLALASRYLHYLTYRLK